MKRRDVRSGAFAGLLLVVGLTLVVLAVDTPMITNADCDNLKGECLRGRQLAALSAILAVYVVVAIWAVAAAVAIVRRRAISAANLCAAGFGVVVIAATLAIDPVGHLDNRSTGWLAAIEMNPVSS